MREKEPYEATKGGPMTRKKAKRLKLKVREGLSLSLGEVRGFTREEWSALSSPVP